MTNTYPTDWDIEAYKDDTEPEHHWELRKEFMRVHKGKFSEEYLVALAKTFTNFEFMGCVYPAPVMARIAELSKDIAKEYRESKKNKLQRTFVSASNAAETKIKNRRSDPGPNTSQKVGPYTSNRSDSYMPRGGGSYTPRGGGSYTPRGGGPYTPRGGGPYNSYRGKSYTSNRSAPYTTNRGGSYTSHKR